MSSKNPFKVGDIVQLKGGSVPMTVSGIKGSKVVCSWPEGKRTKVHEYDAAALMKAEPRAPARRVVF